MGLWHESFEEDGKREQGPGQELSLDRKVLLLSNPATYAQQDDVETMETHFSWLFFVGASVFKLKKPLKKPYVDLSTCALRRQNSELELSLNQRLTHHVYQRLKALKRDAWGRYRVEEAPPDAAVADWLVQQRRLDPRTCMRFLMETQALASSHLEALAEQLVKFYRLQRPLAWAGEDYTQRIQSELLACQKAFERLGPVISVKGIQLCQELARFAQVSQRLIEHRAVSGRIVEGHGDLRPEHVFFEDRPQIIDCLEFSFDLRCRDPMDEMAYLALECEIRARGDVATALLEVFQAIWGERVPMHLVSFYTAFRGLVRAKLAAWRYGEARSTERERWTVRLQEYLTHVERHIGLM